VAVALVAIAVHDRVDSLSPHVVAVVLGVVVANVFTLPPAVARGLKFAGRHVLRAGVVVLGLRLSLGDIRALGAGPFLAVVVVVVVSFFGIRRLARLLGLSPSLGLLVATGYSICGASAIAAVEPLSDADEEEVAYAIALVALCGSLAIGVLPVVGHLLGLSDATFGSWVGASVHDVGQVVAAASSRNSVAVGAAVLVKLTRVAMLAPLVASLSWQRRRAVAAAADRSGATPGVPMFVILFVVAVVLRTTLPLSPGFLDTAKWIETLLLAAGLFALGCGVSIGRLRRLGGRPLVLGLASWALIAVVALLASLVTT